MALRYIVYRVILDILVHVIDRFELTGKGGAGKDGGGKGGASKGGASKGGASKSLVVKDAVRRPKDEVTEEFPPTYLVLRFTPGLDLQAVRWLAQKICGRREDGGGELLLRKQPGTTPSEVGA